MFSRGEKETKVFNSFDAIHSKFTYNLIQILLVLLLPSGSGSGLRRIHTACTRGSDAGRPRRRRRLRRHDGLVTMSHATIRSITEGGGEIDTTVQPRRRERAESEVHRRRIQCTPPVLICTVNEALRDLPCIMHGIQANFTCSP